MKQKHSTIHIELLRCIACFFVIFNHTAYAIRNIAPNDLTKSRIITLLFYFLCKAAVPIFLLITGANLLNKKDSPQKIVKRIAKILLLIFIGSLPYCLIGETNLFSFEYWNGLYHGDYNAAIWYLYLYIGILLMLPILQSIHLTGKQHLYLLALYLLGPGLFPLLNVYFAIPIPSVSLYYTIPTCYVVLVLTGNYLENQIDIHNLSFRKILFVWLSLLLSLVLSFITAIYQLNTTGQIHYDSVYGTTYYSFTVCISICIYLLIRYYFHSCNSRFFTKVIYRFGKYTLGIYLFGEFIRVRLEFVYDYLKTKTSHLASVLIYSLCIFLTGALVMFLFYGIKNFICNEKR